MFIIVCVYLLSLLFDVMRREVFLQVKVSNHNIRGGCEEVAKLLVEDDLATVLGVLETLLDDVLVHELGHLRAGDEFISGKPEKLPQLRRHILLTVEAVVGGARLSLLTIWILLCVLDLADKFGEGLHIGAESNEFGLDGFERHYIFLTSVTFKSQ